MQIFVMCNRHSKYAWVIPLKDKKGITITNAFQKILYESKHRVVKSKGRKSNKIWDDKSSEFKINQRNHDLKKMAWKGIQHVMKENLLLLKDLLES